MQPLRVGQRFTMYLSMCLPLKFLLLLMQKVCCTFVHLRFSTFLVYLTLPTIYYIHRFLLWIFNWFCLCSESMMMNKSYKELAMFMMKLAEQDDVDESSIGAEIWRKTQELGLMK